MRRKAKYERRRQAGLVVSLLAMALAVFGQSQTGQVSGTVVDPTGAVVPSAKVQLIHDLTHNTREFSTEATGAFVFTNLIPGEYTIKIEQPGFKTYEQEIGRASCRERV